MLEHAFDRPVVHAEEVYIEVDVLKAHVDKVMELPRPPAYSGELLGLRMHVHAHFVYENALRLLSLCHNFNEKGS